MRKTGKEVLIDRKPQTLDAQPATRKNVPCLRDYVMQRGGEYLLTTTADFVTPEEMQEALSKAVMAGPATIVRLSRQGRENIYSSIAWEKGTRRLVAQRLPDERFDEDPYEDAAIDSIITVPKSKVEPAHVVECGACGTVLAVRGADNKKHAEWLIHQAGWRNSLARGWVCSEHGYGVVRRKRKPYQKDPEKNARNMQKYRDYIVSKTV